MMIDLKTLKKCEGEEFEFQLSHVVSEDVLGGDRPLSELRCIGSYVLKDGMLELTGKGKMTAAGNCFRCGTPIEYDIVCSLKDSVDIASEEYGDGDRFDMAAFLNEKIMLCQPTKRLCSEDCKGLCPVCGRDLNTGDCDCKSGQGIENPFAQLKRTLDGRNQKKK